LFYDVTAAAMSSSINVAPTAPAAPDVADRCVNVTRRGRLSAAATSGAGESPSSAPTPTP
jgi:hypothetical protein